VQNESILYERLANHKVRCLACARYCELGEDQVGLCGIRGNKDGKLVLYVYGKVAAVHIDPIEKKPVTHFMPGSKIFSIGTTGCNWLCKYCINFDLSQRRKIEGVDITPEKVVEKALETGCNGIAYTYNEPSIFLEYARDCGVLARKNGLFNIFVSNGYGTPESVSMMNEFLDSITVDFKGNGEEKFVRKYIGIPNSQPVFDTLLEIRDKTKIHVEITDLVVPEVGDDLEHAKKLCKFVYDEFGPDMPIHFLQFHLLGQEFRLVPTNIWYLLYHKPILHQCYWFGWLRLPEFVFDFRHNPIGTTNICLIVSTEYLYSRLHQ